MMQNAVLVYRDERLLLIEIAITDKKIYIANVYAPQAKQDKIDFFAHVQHTMDSLDIKKSVILLGDFNSVMDNNLDIVTGEKHNGLEVEALNNWLQTSTCMAGEWSMVTNENTPGVGTSHSQLDD